MKRPYIIITEDTPKEKVIPTLERLGGVNKFDFKIILGSIVCINEDSIIDQYLVHSYFFINNHVEDLYQLDSKTLEPIN